MAISFKCVDMGSQCRWAITASSEDILIETILDHMVHEHNMKEIPGALEEKIKNSVIQIPEY